MHRQTDQRNKTENPETDLCMYYQVTYYIPFFLVKYIMVKWTLVKE